MNQRPPKEPRPWPLPIVAPHTFSANEFSASPFIEDHGDGTSTVTFIHEAPQASAVLIFVNRLSDETSLAECEMEPLADGRWVWAVRMPNAWRASYAFLIHDGDGPAPWQSITDHGELRAVLDAGVPDPLNPDTIINSRGRMQSVVQLPEAPAQPWWHGPVAEGPVEFQVGQRKVWLHSTTGASAESPVFFILDGKRWWQDHGLARGVDQAVAAGACTPVHLLFVDAGDRLDRWRDYGERSGLAQELGTVIVPWAVEQLGLRHDPARMIVAGQSLGGLSALWAVADCGDALGVAIAQSVSLWLNSDAGLGNAAQGEIHLQVGTLEWTLLPLHRDLAAKLRGAGGNIELHEFVGGHDYAWWRGRLLDELVSVANAANHEPS